LLGIDGPPSFWQLTKSSRLVLAGARNGLLAEIVDSLVQGTQFIALTGGRGVGKTMMAESVREELNKRSVGVRWVDGAGGSGIRLRMITSQVVGKPETDIDDGDIEQLFDAMTEWEPAIRRPVLIIDDAEQLLPDAIGYLRLLASVAMERMPQILFVGHSSFWNAAEQAAQAGFEDLIRARFELEPLSPREASAAAQRLMSELSGSQRPVFDSDALELVIQRAGGLVSRLFPLVAVIATMAIETDQTRVTTAVIDAAVKRLEGGPDSLPPPSDGNVETATTMRAFSTSANDCAEVIGTAGALAPLPMAPCRAWSDVRILGAAVALVGSLSVAAYWLIPVDIDPILAGTPTASKEPNARGDVVPASPIIVRLPSSVPQAGLTTSNYDDVIALQTIVAPADVQPPVVMVPKVATPVAARWPVPRKRMVETRPEPSAFATGASKGTWLFPPNPNG